jgi:ubiquitin C-terminal hydrolase
MQMQLRDTQAIRPVSEELLKGLRPLSDADVKADQGWVLAPVGAVSNLEVDAINHSQSYTFARETNRPLVRWRSRLTPQSERPVEPQHLEGLYEDEPDLWEYFVQGAPVITCGTLKSTRQLVNGTPGLLDSLTLRSGEGEGVDLYRPGFRVITLDKPPHAVNVRVSHAFWHGELLDDKILELLDGGSLDPHIAVVPVFCTDRSKPRNVKLLSLFAAHVGAVDSVFVYSHAYILAFAITDYKLQGRSLDKLILSICTRSCNPHLTLDGFYVLVSRSRTLNGLRRLQDDRKALAACAFLRHDPFLSAWNSGYDAEGRWNRTLAAQAYQAARASRTQSAAARTSSRQGPTRSDAAPTSSQRATSAERAGRCPSAGQAREDNTYRVLGERPHVERSGAGAGGGSGRGAPAPTGAARKRPAVKPAPAWRLDDAGPLDHIPGDGGDASAQILILTARGGGGGGFDAVQILAAGVHGGRFVTPAATRNKRPRSPPKVPTGSAGAGSALPRRAPPPQEPLPSTAVAARRRALPNFGNTCYINSVVQALGSSRQLRAALQSTLARVQWVEHLPSASTMHLLWTSAPAGVANAHTAAAPPVAETEALLNKLRKLVAARRPTGPWLGPAQQDAHEWLGLLLEALEDEGVQVRSLLRGLQPERETLPCVVREAHGAQLLRTLTCANGRCAATTNSREWTSHLSLDIGDGEGAAEGTPPSSFSPRARGNDAESGGAGSGLGTGPTERSLGEQQEEPDWLMRAIDLTSAPTPTPVETPSVSSLLRHYFQRSQIERTCPTCDCKLASVHHTIDKPPAALLLHLKRFQVSPGHQGWIKSQAPVRIEQAIDLSKFLTPPQQRFGGDAPPEPQPAGARYALRAVVRHHGTSLAGGHYTSDALVEAVGGTPECLHFNDAIVSATLQSHPGVAAVSDAYLLVYDRIDV